jgi:ubiquinone/menaquinone biosynthesis C-methylase UbiE
MLANFMKQFSGPHGPLGHVAGLMMSRMNVPLNTWVVELLEVARRDRVVEVGFGPGLAVELAASRARDGFVAGVDRSEVMLRQATRRNREGIAAGCIDLRLGSAESLPFTDAAFDKGCAVNSLQFWPAPEKGLAEFHRVLAPGGRLVLALRMRREDAGRYDRSRFGFTEERAAAVEQMLRSTGFATVNALRREVRGEIITALVAAR